MKILTGKSTLAWGLALLTLLTASTGIPAASSPIRLGYTAISPTQSIAWIAQEEGLFRKNGLAAEIIYTRGGGTTIQSLLAGEQQVAQVGGAAALSAMLQGADLAFIALLVRNIYYEFIVGPEIKQVADLKGKKVAISGFGGVSHIATILLLNKYQLIPNKEVAVLRVGGMPEAMVAVMSGLVQGAVLTAPFNAQAMRAGARRLLTMKDENIVFPLNTVAAKKTELEKNRNRYLATLRAFLEAIRFLKTNKHRS
ncbi:MAG: ABC transporter substrate-binding protein, partial [Deltaproteobacteria bacterium]|nr:ABC transporter substrate-binding protein [Deltaproteobacteria bacterium]